MKTERILEITETFKKKISSLRPDMRGGISRVAPVFYSHDCVVKALESASKRTNNAAKPLDVRLPPVPAQYLFIFESYIRLGGTGGNPENLVSQIIYAIVTNQKAAILAFCVEESKADNPNEESAYLEFIEYDWKNARAAKNKTAPTVEAWLCVLLDFMADRIEVRRENRLAPMTKFTQKKPQHAPAVLEVKLRAEDYESPDADAERERREVEWSCQWRVASHYRRLKQKDGTIKTVVVRGFTKGPKDKPLIEKERVVKVVR